MNRRHLAAIALGGMFLAAGSIEFAGTAHSLPLFQHTSTAGFTNAHCLPSGAWAADLSITATDAGKNPTANINTPGGPITGAPVPYHHTFMAQAQTTTYTVSVVVNWNDGVTNNLGSFTATRPDGCTPPTTQAGTTTTTTCAMAIPPRVDCGGATTSAPSTTPVPTTTVAPPSSATTAAATTPPPADVAATSIAAPIFLPTTGGSTNALIAIGLVVLFAGVVLVLVKRRK